MASTDAEVTAVIKKNSKNNNIKGCAKVMEKLPQHILLCYFHIDQFLLAESRYERVKAEMWLFIYIFYFQTIHIFQSQMKKIDLTRKTAYTLSKKDKNQETSYEVF